MIRTRDLRIRSPAAAYEAKARLIAVYTETGSTARLLAGERPPTHIVAFTPSQRTMQKLALVWGIVARKIPPGRTSHELTLDGDRTMREEGLVKAGDRIGHPSCEGGRATGAHVQIARLYNGEWLPAEGPLGFNLEGWVVYNGEAQYQGRLVRNGTVVIADEKGKDISRVTAGRQWSRTSKLQIF